MEPPATQTLAPVIDIMEALKTSLSQMAKKPAVSEKVARAAASVQEIQPAVEVPKRKKLARR